MLVTGLLIVLVLALLGMPVALAILAGTALYYVSTPGLPSDLFFQAFVTGIQSFPLLAVGFFILMGELMTAAGMTKRLVRVAEDMVGHMTGGLGHVNVVTNTLMGGLSGSSNADAAAISRTLVPEMAARGYDRAWSASLTAAGSVIGPIIPPGIGLILYGFLADVSIGDLFIGGIVPGVLLCLALMTVVRISSRRLGYKPSRDRRATLREGRRSLWNATAALGLPVVIVGGIRLGVFTHTEAAAIAVVYALVVGFFVYGELRLQHLPTILGNTLRTTAIIMFIVGAASSFARMLSWERIPNQLAELMISFAESPYVLLAIINIGLLLIGCFAEATAVLIVMTPLLAPVAVSMGIDPVAFGVMVVLNLTIGGITPPLGTMMYTVCAVNGITTTEYVKKIWPFLAAVVGVLLLITYVPSLVTFLPRLLGG
jgi:tripartite ATP-independent transporter DctM subunit